MTWKPPSRLPNPEPFVDAASGISVDDMEMICLRINGHHFVIALDDFAALIASLSADAEDYMNFREMHAPKPPPRPDLKVVN